MTTSAACGSLLEVQILELSDTESDMRVGPSNTAFTRTFQKTLVPSWKCLTLVGVSLALGLFLTSSFLETWAEPEIQDPMAQEAQLLGLVK